MQHARREQKGRLGGTRQAGTPAVPGGTHQVGGHDVLWRYFILAKGLLVNVVPVTGSLDARLHSRGCSTNRQAWLLWVSSCASS